MASCRRSLRQGEVGEVTFDMVMPDQGGVDKAACEALSERMLQVVLRLAKGETVGQAAECMACSFKVICMSRAHDL